MSKIVEPDQVFSPKEVSRLLRWISFYVNPLKPAIIAGIGTFLGVIVCIVVLVQFNVKLPPAPQGGIEVELFFFCCVVGLATFFIVPVVAISVFSDFDKQYFRLTGISEEKYVAELKEEARDEAAIQFTEMPNGANITVFQFPEEQRAEAFKVYEAEFLRECGTEEGQLRFKAYVARRLGLRIPLKK